MLMKMIAETADANASCRCPTQGSHLSNAAIKQILLLM